MSAISATVIADSISYDGRRITSMEVVCHRFILAELNTHRAFSRNSASSRAIPYQRMRQVVMETPAVPISFPAEQKGMSGGAELEGEKRERVIDTWLAARNDAVLHADELHMLGVHKSVINRLLEPFMWHKVLITATEWENFFEQRCDNAQPEMVAVARYLRGVLRCSEPRVLRRNRWHLPYVSLEEEVALLEQGIDPRRISVARCANTSYTTVGADGRREYTYEQELDRTERLITATPVHWSPFEHVATPWPYVTPATGNFTGWAQLRHLTNEEGWGLK